RATGLWDPSAAVPNSPPGSERVADLGDLLFRAWRRGGAWDEARPDGEMLLEALQELGEGRWVPWEAVAGFVRTDSRTPGINRLIERWAQRSGIEAMTVSEVAHRI